MENHIQFLESTWECPQGKPLAPGGYQMVAHASCQRGSSPLKRSKVLNLSEYFRDAWSICPQTISSRFSSQWTVRPRRYEVIAIWQAMAEWKPISNGQLGSLRLRTQSKKFCMCAFVVSPPPTMS